MTTISHVAGFPVQNESTGLTTLSVTTVKAGDLVVFSSQIHSTTISITGVALPGVKSANGAGVLERALYYVDTVNNVKTQEIWWGVVETPGADTLTVTYSGSVAALTPELVADSFTTDVAVTWQFVQSAGRASAGPTGTLSWPGLGFLNGLVNPGLYWGYGSSGQTMSAGSNPGFTYNIYASTGNGQCYYLNFETQYEPGPSCPISPSTYYTATAAMFNAAVHEYVGHM